MRQVLRNERKYLINTADLMAKTHQFRKLLHEDPHNRTTGRRGILSAPSTLTRSMTAIFLIRSPA